MNKKIKLATYDSRCFEMNFDVLAAPASQR
jgi:hypothetical protein